MSEYSEAEGGGEEVEVGRGHIGARVYPMLPHSTL